MKETIAKIIDQFGVDILLDGNRFCSIVDDYASDLPTERKVLRRIKDLQLLKVVHQSIKQQTASMPNELQRLDILLKDEGFSPEWRIIAADIFGYPTSADQEMDEVAGTSQQFSKSLPESNHNQEFDANSGRTTSNPEVDNLLQRAYFHIEDDQWDFASECFNRVLDTQLDNSEAYLGLVLVETHCKTRDELMDYVLSKGAPDSSNWRRAKQFARSDIKQWFASIRVEKEKKELCAEQVAATLQAELKRAGTPDLASLLKKARADLEDITSFSNSFKDEISKLNSMIQEKDSMEKELSSLRIQRSKLGIFAGKEKRRIDEETAGLESKIRSFRSIIQAQEQKTRGYQSASQVQSAVQEARSSVEDLEKRITQEKQEAANRITFDEAKKIYDNDSCIRDVVETKIPGIGMRLEIKQGNKIVHFGRYRQDGKDPAKKAIEWIVLRKQGNRVLVISKYGLECMKFNNERVSFTWQSCSSRKWLNGDFLQEAFTAEERAMIPQVTVSAEKNQYGQAYAGQSTTDQVFLLSISEAQSLFANDHERACTGSEYCYSQGAKREENGNVYWWLRTPGGIQTVAAGVYASGMVDECGQFGDIDRCAIRPAIWITVD